MADFPVDRRLAAILALDVVGYSRLMGADEAGTLARLKACRRMLIDPTIAEHRGRIVKLMGDGTLVEFASVVDAVQCAAAIQRAMSQYDLETPEATRIRLRIGVNLGDVIVEGDDLYGDGVNIAARLEGLAETGGIFVSGTAFDHANKKTDVGFAYVGERRLKNIASPVRVYRVLLNPGQTGKIMAAPRWPRSRALSIAAGMAALLVAAAAGIFMAVQKPSAVQGLSVAVLPFANLSGDPGQEYFTDGITEDLITDLSKLSGLDVAARNSVFAYKGKLPELADIRSTLGVRFVVEGSVRRTGDQIRLNAQLVDTQTGDNLWADRFDRATADVFTVQEEMSRQIAKALGVQASAAETERMTRPPTSNLEAYDYYLRAEQAARTGERAGLRKALELYDKAEELDPAFAEAFAADARTTVYIWRTSFNDIIQSAPARKRAYEKASSALKLDPGLSSPYAILGIMQVVDRHYEEAIASAKRAVALDPKDAEAQIALGYVQLFSGNHDEASTAIETAMKLDPNLSAIDREIAGLSFLLQGNTAAAIEALTRTCADAPALGGFRIMLAAAFARAGRLGDAQEAVARGFQLIAGANSLNWRSLAAWRIGYSHLRNADDLALIVDALQQAGVPQWPFGFTADPKDQLTGAEISALVVGQTLHGQLEPGALPAMLQVGNDGRAAFRSATRMITETVFVDAGLLCEQSENNFGRPDCGPVYKRDDAGGAGYTYVNSSKVFQFDKAD